jgi:hypothetical protein
MDLIKVQEHLYVPTDFAKHHYYFADAEGKRKYTGITSILGVIAKPMLIGWAARMATEYVGEHLMTRAFPNLSEGVYDPEAFDLVLAEAKSAHTRKKEEAGAHGTDAHALVEGYINDCLSTYEGRPFNNLQILPEAIRPFWEWATKNVDHFLFSERRMAHPELFIAGTADFAYVDKEGRRVMSDFKTSGSIWDEYWYQVAAYTVLAEGEGDEPYDYMSIVRLGKDGEFEVAQVYDYQTTRKGFLAALDLYRANAAIKGVVVH